MAGCPCDDGRRVDRDPPDANANADADADAALDVGGDDDDGAHDGDGVTMIAAADDVDRMEPNACDSDVDLANNCRYSLRCHRYHRYCDG